MLSYSPERIIVLDQGSRRGPTIVDDEDVKCLVVDHHSRVEGENPQGAIVCVGSEVCLGSLELIMLGVIGLFGM